MAILTEHVIEDIMHYADGYGKLHYDYTPSQVALMEQEAKKWESEVVECQQEKILVKCAQKIVELLRAGTTNGEAVAC